MKTVNRIPKLISKQMHNQLSAIFNHAMRYYDLKSNPAAKAGHIGEKEAGEMEFWTKEEYQKFAYAVMDKPMSFYAFEILYWCGIRVGELLALTPADFDFENRLLRINKSYQRIKGRDVITDPKTKKSIRTIKMPKFLCEEIDEYIKMLYGIKPNDRIFTVTKSFLHTEMKRGSKVAGVKRIKIHGLRHPYVKLKLKISSAYHCRIFGTKVLDFPHDFKPVIGIYAHLFNEHIRKCLC